MTTHSTDIVFLPGWSYRASVFEKMRPYFPLHRLHFIDVPRLDEASYLHHLADTLPQHAALIGWSLGGLIAIDLCAQYPDRFKQLVLLASTPKFIADQEWRGIHPDNAASFLHNAQHNLQETLDQFQSLTCYPSRAAREYFAAHAYDAQTHPYLLNELHFLFQTDLRTSYFSRTQPALSIHGESDAVLNDALANSHVIPNAGHGLLFTHTDEICERIHHYLGQPA